MSDFGDERVDFHDVSSSAQRLAALAIDTKRQRNLNTLKESESRFRALVETISDWVWEVDEYGVYTYVGFQIQLDISRLELGQITLARERVDLGQLVQNVVNQMAVLSVKHQIELVRSDSVVVEGEFERLERIVRHMIKMPSSIRPWVAELRWGLVSTSMRRLFRCGITGSAFRPIVKNTFSSVSIALTRVPRTTMAGWAWDCSSRVK
jgi:PAS domain-containing protein